MIRALSHYAILAVVLKGMLATGYSINQSAQQVSEGLGRDLYVERVNDSGQAVWKLKSYTFEPTCLEVAFAKNWWADFSTLSRDVLEGPDTRFQCSGRTKKRAISN